MHFTIIESVTMHITVFYFVPIFVTCSIPDDNVRFKCGGALPYVKEDDLPEFEPSKYTAADPAKYKPYKIHFVMASNISEQMKRILNETTAFVNGKLSAILKTAPLVETRRARQWNDTLKRCNPAVCNRIPVPGKYALPCQDALGFIQKEDDVPIPIAKEIDLLNTQNDISLVVYVVAEDPSVDAICESTVVAYAGFCQVDSATFRPTHGYVKICRALKLVGEQAKRVLLHETLHILNFESVIGAQSPAFQGCTGNIPSCENITYKAVQRKWMEANGTWSTRRQYLATTPNVKKAAQEYFGCATLEGAETQRGFGPERYPNGTVANASFPMGHWSKRAFPDEILAPTVDGTMRLSALTLGLLKDLGWYEVDMSAAEPMETTRPKKDGCEVAQKSCHEIINMTRSKNPGGVVVDMAPYCDNKYNSKDRIISPLCNKGGDEPRMCTDLNPDRCPVVAFRYEYNDYTCATMKTQANVALPLGGMVGPGTMCLTMAEVKTSWLIGTSALALCVGYRCDRDEKRVIAELRPHGEGKCEIHCPAAKSNELLRVNFSNGSFCEKYLGASMLVICPNFTTMCPFGSTTMPTSTKKLITTPPSKTPTRKKPTGVAITTKDLHIIGETTSSRGMGRWKCNALVMTVMAIAVFGYTWHG